MTEKILVEHLVKKYGDNTVLNDINVSINEGDVVCVIGPSGSGKSTFLRCLNQLEEASSGDIIIDGANLTDKNTDINQVRQHIGMVFPTFQFVSTFIYFRKHCFSTNRFRSLIKRRSGEKSVRTFRTCWVGR